MHGLEEEYHGALATEILDAKAAENQTALKAFGFGTHGMVLRDAKGSVRKTIDGHLIDEPVIRKAIKEVMGK